MSGDATVADEQDQQPAAEAADPFTQALDEAIAEAGTEVGEVEDLGAEAAPEPVAVVPAEPVVEAPPTFYSFPSRYDDKGQRSQKATPVTLEGLAWNADTRTITITNDAAGERLQQLLQRGRIEEVSEPYRREQERQVRQLRQEVETRKAEQAAEVEQAAGFLAQLNDIMAIPDDEQYLRHMLQLRADMPRLRAEATMARANKMMEQARAAQQPPEPDVEQIVEQASQGALGIAQEILADQPWVTDDVRDDLEAYLTDRRLMGQWIARAERDLPDQGFRAGQYVANWDTLRELAMHRVAPYRAAHDRITATQRTAAETARVAQQNAAVLGQKPGAKPQAAPPKPTAPAPRQTREEFQRALREKERATLNTIMGS